MPRQGWLLLEERGGWRETRQNVCGGNEAREMLNIIMCGLTDAAGSWGFYLLFFVCLFLRGIGRHEKILCPGQTRSEFCLFKRKVLLLGSCVKTRPKEDQEDTGCQSVEHSVGRMTAT